MEWMLDCGLKAANGFFKDVNYYVIGNVHKSVENLLKDGGGKKHSYLSDMISHVIAGDDDTGEINVAKELYQLPVVTSVWVLRSVQCSYLLPTKLFDPDPCLKIFADVVVCPSQLSPIDNKIVWALVTCYGGRHQLKLNRSVTHLVTAKAEGAKYERVCCHESSLIKIVTPDWILDSVRSKKCKDERNFHPRLLTAADYDDRQSDVTLPELTKSVSSLSASSSGCSTTLPVQQHSTTHHISKGISCVAKISISHSAVPANKMVSEVEQKIYHSHDPAEHVPPDVCLLGCIFYIADYQKYIDAAALLLWKQVILQYGGQVDDSYSNRITHVLCEQQNSDVFQLALRDGKRLVTAHWLNDCLASQKMKVPSVALHFPCVFGRERPGCNQLICVTNFEGDDRHRVKLMIAQIGAKYTGYLTRANSVVVAKHSGGTKYTKACEWGIPVVGVNWLNDIMLGDLNALKLPIQSCYRIQDNQPSPPSEDVFDVDRAKVSHLLDGWKTPVKIPREIWKKFQSYQLGRLSTDTLDSNLLASVAAGTASSVGTRKHVLASESCYPEKKPKLLDFTVSQDLQAGPFIVMTGIHDNEASRLSKEISRLGGRISQSVHIGCTHLIANSVVRTVKFLMAFGVVKHIVTSEWIVQSSLANRFLDESEFRLRDNKVEETFNFRLHTSLYRALEQPLFQDLTFYFTPGVQPSKSILCKIVKSSGGKFCHKLPSVKQIIEAVNSKGEPTFIIVSCEADLFLLRDVNSHHIGIHNAEFVLTGVMRQEVDFHTYRMN